MKKLVGVVTLLAFLGAAPMVSAAKKSESVDLKEMTCKDLDSMDKETLSMMLFWLDGYLSGVSDDTSFNPENLGKFVESLADACTKKPSGKVIEIAKEVGLE